LNSRASFRFSIRAWLLLFLFGMVLVWGGYVVWDARQEAAADKFLELVDWESPEDYYRLEEATGTLSPAVERKVLKKLKEKYPLVSLSGRLDYEQKWGRRKEWKKIEREVQGVEGPDGAWVFHETRKPALQHLHEGRVREFVSSQGFGFGRMEIFSNPEGLSPFLGTGLGEQTPAKLAVVDRSEFHADFGKEVGPSPAVLSQAPSLPPWKNESPFNLYEKLSETHRDFMYQFSSLPEQVYVKSVKEVAGFESHEISRKFQLGQDKQKAEAGIPLRELTFSRMGSSGEFEMMVRRMDLVSLLRYQKPKVYLTDKLPNMEELDTESVRDLDSFETSALKRLREGEELVVRQKGKTLLMFGAIRAKQSCLECHSVQEEDLLGAFSYVLEKTPLPKNPANSSGLQPPFTEMIPPSTKE